jgi:hypothetical protein
MKRRSVGWTGTFVALVIVIFLTVQYVTGYDAIGAAARFLWNVVALIVNGVMRMVSGLAGAFARSIGLRRLGHFATTLTGVGLGYAGSVILNDAKLARAHGWRDKLRLAIAHAHDRWHDLHIIWKLLLVAGLIASQVYLQFLLIVFRGGRFAVRTLVSARVRAHPSSDAAYAAVAARNAATRCSDPPHPPSLSVRLATMEIRSAISPSR